MPLRRPIVVISSAVALMASGALAAQQPQLPDSTRPLDLPGVTVTVLGTELPLARTPHAVSVSEGEAVGGGRPGLGLDEALRAIPGVQIDNRYNYALGERIAIRGFGARAQFGVRGLQVLVDGIPATFPDGQTSLSHVDLGFLSRVEVIRGPAGSLYGGSAGGVLQLDSREPAPGERIRLAGLSAGSHGLLRAEAAVGSASDRGGFLVRGSHQGYAGARDHSDARNLRLHATGRYTSSLGELRLSASAVDYDADNPGSLSAELLAEDRTQAFRNNVLQRTGEEGRQLQAGAQLRRAAGPGELELSAYGISREVLNPIPGVIIDLDRTVAGGRVSYALSVAAATLTVGAEAAIQRDGRVNFANVEGDKGSVVLDQDEEVDELGLFAQAAVRPFTPLTLLGGIRYDLYRFEAEDALITPDNPDDSGSRRLSRASPSLGASLLLAPGTSLYANVATAFETPTTTELANRPDGSGGFNPELKPQETVSYELGGRVLRGGVAIDLAAYHADISNALIPFEVAGAPGRQFFRNAGAARHRGIEAGLATSLLGYVDTRLAYTFTDARFGEHAPDAPDVEGNRIPGIAPHRGDLAVRISSGSPFLGLDLRYASRTAVNDNNSASSPAYTVVDARVGLRGLRAGGLMLDPVVGISNILDEEYNSSVVVNAFGQRYFEPAPGRALHVGLRVAL